ncbi:MAG: hypothetical protein ABJG78_06655 [Cyclobacteriaceae bacterium]
MSIRRIIRFSFLQYFLLVSSSVFSQEKTGIRGDKEAIAEAETMVEAMGGKKIWSQLKSVHFVHKWYFWNKEPYIENEILDLTGSRSWVEMKNEIYHRLRAYSPENKYWNVINGEFAYTSEESFDAAMGTAPYNIFRLARAVAIGDPSYEVEYGEEEFPGSRRLEFSLDGEYHGHIVLNAKGEPLIWATTRYQYTFGPMAQFGNLRVPNWAIHGKGAVSYEMISLIGDNQQPDPKLFIPPAKYTEN